MAIILMNLILKSMIAYVLKITQYTLHSSHMFKSSYYGLLLFIRLLVYNIYLRALFFSKINSNIMVHILHLLLICNLFSMAEGKDMFYLTTHSIHFIYGYMASGILCHT